MKIRRYMGKNTQEAILKVKMDLGSEAVIINTRKVRQKGLFKIFAKPLVEVLAAIDDDFSSKEKQNAKLEEKKLSAIAQNISESKNDSKINELEGKVNSMESLLQKIYEQIQPKKQEQKVEETKAQIEILVPIKEPEENNSDLKICSETEIMHEESEKKTSNVTKILQELYENLVKNEVDKEIAQKIMDNVRERIGGSTSEKLAAMEMQKMLANMLGCPETIRLRTDGKPTVIIFVGPTGVGKTTTLAKIAANYALNHKKTVGLITGDTYRIAAVEQLKTYAEILAMPVSVIYSPSEINDAINSYSDKDIILIDTAGRSYKNKTQFDELKTLVNASNADEIYLVLSVTTSNRICKELLKNYSFLEKYKLIFTKLDEAPISGIILNAKVITGKSLSYITTGQSVPDDIEIANVEKLSQNLLGSLL